MSCLRLSPLRRTLLLAAVLLTPSLPAQTPDPGAHPDPYATLLTIRKNGSMTLRLDGRNRTVTLANLTQTLTKAGNPTGRTVYIKASPAVTYGTVHDALTRVQAAGITNVSIVGKP